MQAPDGSRRRSGTRLAEGEESGGSAVREPGPTYARASATYDSRAPEMAPRPGAKKGGGFYQRLDTPIVKSLLGIAEGELEEDPFPGSKVGGIYQMLDPTIVDGDVPYSLDIDVFPAKEQACPFDQRLSTRSSARLTSVRQVSALERAKLRKATLLEGQFSGCQRKNRKVLKKSAQCGVKLTGVEAEELQKFLLRG